MREFISIDCADEYGFMDEESGDFMDSWKKRAPKKQPVTFANMPWTYQESSALDGYPFWAELTTYLGGGYTQELFPKWNNAAKLKELKDKQWLDRHTRALFVEFAVFNAATNHFSVVNLVFEFAETGGCIHFSSILTFKLYRYTTGYAIFVIACEVLFLICLLILTYREIKEAKALGFSAYIRQFWNIVEVIAVGLAIISIGFYFYRIKLANDLLKKLPAKRPDRFINFQFAAYWSQVFIYIVALLVFFISIKFIKLLRFNKKMSLLASTLKASWYPLGMFSIVITIVLYGSFIFGNIVFGKNLYGYRNMFVTAATQISLLLGKFSYKEYESTNRILGPLFFFLYIIMVNWILMNMFVSIINDAFEDVQADVKKQDNDYEIIDFIMDHFKAWSGFGRSKKSQIQENIRWQSAKSKMTAVSGLLDGTPARKNQKEVRWQEDEIFGLSNSLCWKESPGDDMVRDGELDIKEVNRTVDRFIDCINLLYFEDVQTAEKMSKKAKKEISEADYVDIDGTIRY